MGFFAALEIAVLAMIVIAVIVAIWKDRRGMR